MEIIKIGLEDFSNNIYEVFANYRVIFSAIDPLDSSSYKALLIHHHISELLRARHKKCCLFVLCGSSEDADDENMQCFAKLVKKIAPNAIIVTCNSFKISDRVQEKYGQIVKASDSAADIISLEHMGKIVGSLINDFPDTQILMGNGRCIDYFSELLKCIGEKILVGALRGNPILANENILREGTKSCQKAIGFIIKYQLSLYQCPTEMIHLHAMYSSACDMISEQNLTGTVAMMASLETEPYADTDVFAFITYVLHLLGNSTVSVKEEIISADLLDNLRIYLFRIFDISISRNDTAKIIRLVGCNPQWHDLDSCLL